MPVHEYPPAGHPVRPPASRRNPALTVVIVASLAIGIGANTAIFSVVSALLLKPLPYPDPERLVVLWLRSPGINIPQDWPSPGQYIDVRTGNHSFEEMSISQGRSGTLLGLDQPERVDALFTSSSLFHLLGARPLYGRLLVSDDDVPGKPRVVILSHAFWARLFNSDPNVVGRTITLNGIGNAGGGPDKNQFTVAGVLRRDFLMNEEVMPTVASIHDMDVFLALPLGADAVTRRGDENYSLMARLKPDVTIDQARADVRAIHDVDPTIPVYDVRTMDDRMRDSMARQRFSTMMLGAFAVFALILAVVGVYGVMSHLVTQGTHDIGVCMALGASRGGIVRTVIRRGIELTGAGIVVGLVGAVLLTSVMASLLFGVSATDALTFSLVPVLLTGIAIAASYLPARRATLVDPVVALREE